MREPLYTPGIPARDAVFCVICAHLCFLCQRCSTLFNAVQRCSRYLRRQPPSTIGTELRARFRPRTAALTYYSTRFGAHRTDCAARVRSFEGVVIAFGELPRLAIELNLPKGVDCLIATRVCRGRRKFRRLERSIGIKKRVQHEQECAEREQRTGDKRRQLSSLIAACSASSSAGVASIGAAGASFGSRAARLPHLRMRPATIAAPVMRAANGIA